MSPPIFEGPALTLENRVTLKREFLDHYTYLTLEEQALLSRFYDTMEKLYEEAEPREALNGEPRERYFAHVRRVMLIPIEAGIQAPLEWIYGWGGHDLEEETPYTSEWFAKEYGIMPGKITHILTIPGKRPGIQISQHMRAQYYERVKLAPPCVRLAVRIGFVADHYDAAMTIHCLPAHRQERKVWEINTICKPFIQTDIADAFPKPAQVLLEKIDLALTFPNAPGIY